MFPMQMSAILGVEVKLGFSRKTLANSASADDIAQRQEKGWKCQKKNKRRQQPALCLKISTFPCVRYTFFHT